VPSAGAKIVSTPNTIQLWFSEAPEAALTTITLTTSDGRIIQLGKVTAVPDTSASVMATVNGVLAPGDYTVKWRTVAADDGHPSNGSFSFTVATVTGATGIATTGIAPPGGSTTAIPGEPSAKSNTMSGMDVESPAYVIVRWLSFMGLVLLIGVIAFRMLVLPRVGASPAVALAQVGTHEVLAATMIPRLATLGLVAGLTVVIAAIGRLLAEQAVMAASMTMGVTDIVRQTAWGSAWLLQIGTAIVACAGFALARRRLTIGWIVATVATLVLAVTPALSGHAAGVPHFRTLAITTDAIHVIAAGAWLGSLCALVFVGLPTAIRTQPRNTSTGLVADMTNAFSPVALTFAAIVVLTGLISAWLRLGSVSALWRTSYGVVLLVKLALVGCVFAAGAFNWLRMRAALTRHALAHATVHAASDGSESLSMSSGTHVRFQRSGTFELVFGALVIAATAVLVAMPTPVH
jgi:putative copper export protein